MKWVTAIILAGLTLALVACDKMANQPKRLPFELPYGSEAAWPLLPPPDTIARDAALHAPSPPPATLALLQRGQQRFDIYCAPCHSRAGDGNGMIVQRGFPHPPSYFSPTLMQAPNRLFYDVITSGYGAMFPYGDRVAPADRWAIVAYIRALQASNHATLADVPSDQRKSLQ